MKNITTLVSTYIYSSVFAKRELEKCSFPAVHLLRMWETPQPFSHRALHFMVLPFFLLVPTPSFHWYLGYASLKGLLVVIFIFSPMLCCRGKVLTETRAEKWKRTYFCLQGTSLVISPGADVPSVQLLLNTWFKFRFQPLVYATCNGGGRMGERSLS